MLLWFQLTRRANSSEISWPYPGLQRKRTNVRRIRNGVRVIRDGVRASSSTKRFAPRVNTHQLFDQVQKRGCFTHHHQAVQGRHLSTPEYIYIGVSMPTVKSSSVNVSVTRTVTAASNAALTKACIRDTSCFAGVTLQSNISPRTHTTSAFVAMSRVVRGKPP